MFSLFQFVSELNVELHFLSKNDVSHFYEKRLLTNEIEKTNSFSQKNKYNLTDHSDAD